MPYGDVQAGLPANFISGYLSSGQTWGTDPVSSTFRLPNLPAVAFTFWTGTGSQLGKVNLFNISSGTLTNVTPGTTDTADVDLAAWADFVGASKNFVEVVMLGILNFATTDGVNLVVGGSSASPATNPFTAVHADMATPNLGRIRVLPGFPSPTNSAVTIPGGYVIWGGNLACYPTSGSSKVLRVYTASASLPYRIIGSGRDSAT